MTYLSWRAGNKAQDAIKADADARIAEAGGVAKKADVRAAEAGTEAANANEAAAKANERAQRLEAENLAVRGKVAELEEQAADARARAAEAERLLAEVNERTKDRHVTLGRRGAFVTALLPGQGQKISIVCEEAEDEARVFATELITAFRDAGWDVDDRTNSIRVPSERRGLAVVVRDLMAIPARVEAIESSFAAVGLRAALFADGAGGPNDVRIVVGSK
jgi:hypothetical protein